MGRLVVAHDGLDGAPQVHGESLQDFRLVRVERHLGIEADAEDVAEVAPPAGLVDRLADVDGARRPGEDALHGGGRVRGDADVGGEVVP